MNRAHIEWDEAWRQARDAQPRRSTPDYWSRRAPSFARHCGDGQYESEILRLLQPEPSWSVLDVGCGAGTLAIPLARRVASVTALDFAPGMLEVLSLRCREEGVGNVTPVLGAWEDDWGALGLGSHDLAVASRSLAVREIRPALTKLCRAARRRACVTAPVGDGPIDRRVVEAVGRPFHAPPDYIYLYNVLYEMGVHAHVAIVPGTRARSYASHEEAATVMGAVLDGLSDEETARLRAYLIDNLVPRDGRLHLRAPRPVRWAVMWWDKPGEDER
jgi:SAM-dependent methyltransferase